MKRILFIAAAASFFSFCGCEELDDDPDKYLVQDPPAVPLEDVAQLLSEIPLGKGQLSEVYDAVTSSTVNGYDEEYMMRDLFVSPGSGVGDDRLSEKSLTVKREKLLNVKREKLLSVRREGSFTVKQESMSIEAQKYDTPLRDLIEDALKKRLTTRASDNSGLSVEEYLDLLRGSDIQIYWPYSDNWDGETTPIITFDPNDGSVANTGYRLTEDESTGKMSVEEVTVDESVAQKQPVWVVNRNDDSEYTSLELLRMESPDWGSGGGNIIVRPKSESKSVSVTESKSESGIDPETASEHSGQMLVLKDFTMHRNFDPWFAGASEFFVKVGSVEDFTASTEAELKLYSPSITDFMIVVKRRNEKVPQPFNAVLVSEWTPQLSQCAFMITEDDGGTKTTWKCSAVVKVQSKSYGFDISLPINTRDDVVWRGQLSRNYLFAHNGEAGHFGDVDITFEIVDY